MAASAHRVKNHHLLAVCLLGLLPCSCSFDGGAGQIPPPQPLKIQPDERSSAKPVPVVISGNHFIPKITRTLAGKTSFVIDDTFGVQLVKEGDAPVPLLDTAYESINALYATVPAGIPPGLYSLIVISPYGLKGILDEAYTVSSSSGDSALDTDTDSESSTTDSSVSCGGTAVWRPESGDDAFVSKWDENAFLTPAPALMADAWRIIVGDSSPVRSESIVVGVDHEREMTGMMWDGSKWNNLPFNPLDRVSSSYYWAFSVSYEQKSGDGIVVWNNAGPDSNNLSYKVWNGTEWSPESVVDTTDSTEPRHMVMSANPVSDEMTLVFNKNGADFAIVWDGDSFGDLQLLDDSAGDTDIYVDYEQKSGRAMVVYGKEGRPEGYYRIWNGTSWSAEGTIAPPPGETAILRWCALAADPSSNRLAFGAITRSELTRSHIWLKIWDGTSWVDSIRVTTKQEANVNYPNIALAFESQTGNLLAAYTERTSATRVHYRTWTPTARWSVKLDGPEIGENGKTMMLYPDPGSDDIVLLVQNQKRQLHAALFRNKAWTDSSILEDDTGEDKNQPFTFLWNKLCPAP